MFELFLLFLVWVMFVVFVGMAALLWLGCQRVAMYLQDKPDAIQSVVEHVLMPLFGRKQAVGSDASLDAFAVGPDTDRS